jgi:hypothetical protein
MQRGNHQSALAYFHPKMEIEHSNFQKANYVWANQTVKLLTYYQHLLFPELFFVCNLT